MKNLITRPDHFLQTPLTAKRLREVLAYDPVTGEFRARPRAGRGRGQGAVAASNRKFEYRIITVDGRKFTAHRLAWFYIHGKWPSGALTPRNGDAWDTRIENLRQITVRQTFANMRLRKNNSSGITGVMWCKSNRRWCAFICKKKLGYYPSKEAAIVARFKAARRVFGDHFSEPRGVAS